MSDLLWVLRGIEGVVLLLGVTICYASLRAYARTGNRSLALLGAGFVLVTVAAALAGILYELVTHDLLSAWVVSAALDAGGFAFILASIVSPRVVRGDPPAEEPPPPSPAP